MNSDAEKGFKDTDVAMLVGAKPRGPGMERADLMKANAKIFEAQGKALNKVASRNVRVVVVGNPANTNAMIAASHAPELDNSCFTAMTRLDQNRAMSQVAQKANVPMASLDRLTIWGNHSATQVPDVVRTVCVCVS